MPIFEFRCQACGNEFEKLVFGSDEVECPSCHQKEVEKLMSACSAKVGYKFTATSNPKGASCGGCSSGSCSTCH
ncbi:MAG: FmdB family zinc ribbon protein [Desulfobaccales bacterium]